MVQGKLQYRLYAYRTSVYCKETAYLRGEKQYVSVDTACGDGCVNRTEVVAN